VGITFLGVQLEYFFLYQTHLSMIIIIAKTLEIIAVAFIYGIILMVLARIILNSMGYSS
jgi:hypothetical protein